MARVRVSPHEMRWFSGLACSVAIVAAMTGLILLLNVLLHTTSPTFRAAYTLAVLAVALFWGSWQAAVAAVLTSAIWAYLSYSYGIPLQLGNREALTSLGVFLVMAVVVGRVAGRLRRTARETARLAQEQS